MNCVLDTVLLYLNIKQRERISKVYTNYLMRIRIWLHSCSFLYCNTHIWTLTTNVHSYSFMFSHPHLIGHNNIIIHSQKLFCTKTINGQELHLQINSTSQYYYFVFYVWNQNMVYLVVSFNLLQLKNHSL